MSQQPYGPVRRSRQDASDQGGELRGRRPWSVIRTVPASARLSNRIPLNQLADPVDEGPHLRQETTVTSEGRDEYYRPTCAAPPFHHRR
jgi:hypothetical protein